MLVAFWCILIVIMWTKQFRLFNVMLTCLNLLMGVSRLSHPIHVERPTQFGRFFSRGSGVKCLRDQWGRFPSHGFHNKVRARQLLRDDYAVHVAGCSCKWGCRSVPLATCLTPLDVVNPANNFNKRRSLLWVVFPTSLGQMYKLHGSNQSQGLTCTKAD